MKSLHYKLIGVCLWFFFFYNIEKLFGAVNIATFVYVLVLVYAVLVILLRPLQRMALHWLLLLSLVPYFVLEVASGRPMSFPLVVTEICAIWITIALIKSTTDGMESMRETVAELTLGTLDKETDPFDTGQSRIYHEIRRARRFQRPASLLALSTTEQSAQMSLDRFVKEAQQEIINKYMKARVARFLAEELRDPNIILQRNDHFIVLLPEATREDAAEIIKQIKNAAQEDLGLDFQVGLATFPDEAVTFETLLQNAETEMNALGAERTGEVQLPSARINRALS